MCDKKLNKNEAKKRIGVILSHGDTSFSSHALKEMASDEMETPDVVNVLRAGRIHAEGELVNGTYRYRVETEKMLVVVAFRSATELRVVTAWRKK